MAGYSQFAFALSPDDSELVIFLAGQRKGTAAVDALPPPSNYILNEDGTPILDENGNPILAE